MLRKHLAAAAATVVVVAAVAMARTAPAACAVSRENVIIALTGFNQMIMTIALFVVGG